MTDATDSTSATPRKAKGRSPSYPALDLETAIRRAGELWAQDQQHPAAVDTVVKHWGYKSLNGPASTTLAALKKFGLTDDQGQGTARRVRVSDLAVNILANPDEKAKRAAIQTAALAPKIHRELWDRYGAELPSDATLKWELTRDRGFTQTGADEFIPEYRTTISYAQLRADSAIEAQTSKDHAEDDADEEDEIPDPPKHPRRRRMSGDSANVLTIPLMGGSPVVVEGEFPITEQDWDQLMAVLNAMKPGLVSQGDPEDDD